MSSLRETGHAKATQSSLRHRQIAAPIRHDNSTATPSAISTQGVIKGSTSRNLEGEAHLMGKLGRAWSAAQTGPACSRGRPDED